MTNSDLKMATNNLFGFMLLILMNHSLLFPSSFALWLTASLLRVNQDQQVWFPVTSKLALNFRDLTTMGGNFGIHPPLT